MEEKVYLREARKLEAAQSIMVETFWHLPKQNGGRNVPELSENIIISSQLKMPLSSFEEAMKTIACVFSEYLEKKKGACGMSKDRLNQMMEEQLPHIEKTEIRPGVFALRVPLIQNIATCKWGLNLSQQLLAGRLPHPTIIHSQRPPLQLRRKPRKRATLPLLPQEIQEIRVLHKRRKATEISPGVFALRVPLEENHSEVFVVNLMVGLMGEFNTETYASWDQFLMMAAEVLLEYYNFRR
ncbi:uncharacterized protein LOC132583076 [Heteronotia binoei]|uniref:uncharacterized protein LOC132583076 n=1 Tax=Heteronotia binoei TaxID=13085 RepID=UPI00292EA588|nr:uncharacterized protein LOC132583076 [Heteronotia binoei]